MPGRVIEIGWKTPPPLVGIGGLEDALLRDVAEGIRGTLVRLAQERLHLSADAYIQGLHGVEYFNGGARIVLEGWLANAVEQGLDPFDMKDGLLSGRNAKVSKDGSRYNIVPFRHGGPRSRGTSFQRVGAAYGPQGANSRRGSGPLTDGDARSLGSKVWRAATKAHKAGKPLQAGLAGKVKEHHKTDIFAGMQKPTKTYVKSRQSHNMTFRTVSSKSDSRAFMHPGVEARHLFRDAEAEIDALTKSFLDKALRHLKPTGTV